MNDGPTKSASEQVTTDPPEPISGTPSDLESQTPVKAAARPAVETERNDAPEQAPVETAASEDIPLVETSPDPDVVAGECVDSPNRFADLDFSGEGMPAQDAHEVPIEHGGEPAEPTEALAQREVIQCVAPESEVASEQVAASTVENRLEPFPPPEGPTQIENIRDLDAESEILTATGTGVHPAPREQVLYTCRKPIVIIAYNRPTYLTEVLASLVASGAQSKDIYMFIDGSSDADILVEIRSCIEIFKRFVPSGTCFDSGENLGIAANFRRAEAFVFNTLSAPVAYFFEDDMIVSPSYLQIMDRLASIAEMNPRIGAFAAYGVHHKVIGGPVGPHSAMTAMIWNWGFGLTREAWLKRESLLSGYYELLGDAPYRNRPFAKIGHWCRAVGFGVLAEDLEKTGSTSQDVVKKSALAILGAASIMPRAVNARYIGEIGQNFGPAAYAEFQFAEAKYEEGFTSELIVTDLERETTLGIEAQDGHCPTDAAPSWLRDATFDLTLNDLFEIYNVDEHDRHSIEIMDEFFLDMYTLSIRYPSIGKGISKSRRALSHFQRDFVSSSSITTISTCFERHLKTGFHYTISHWYFIDSQDDPAPKLFSYIEVGDISLIARDVDFTDWLEKAFCRLAINGSILGAARHEHAGLYQDALSAHGAIFTNGPPGYLRFELVRQLEGPRTDERRCENPGG